MTRFGDRKPNQTTTRDFTYDKMLVLVEVDCFQYIFTQQGDPSPSDLSPHVRIHPPLVVRASRA
jgi:hypothetical protein